MAFCVRKILPSDKINLMTFTQRHTLIAKGAAILLLLHYHIFIGYSGLHYALAQITHCCVWIFVFLSGFGLSASFAKSGERKTSPVSWLLKHIWNLESFFWPHFLIGVAILYFYVGRGLMAQYGKVWRIILDFFCLSDIFGQTHILSVWWYMGLAIIIVLLVPALVKITDKIGYFVIPLAAVLILLVPDFIGSDDMIGPYQGYYLAAVLGVVSSRKNLLDRYVTYAGNTSRGPRIILSILFLFSALALGMLLCLNIIPASFYLPQLIKTVVAVLVILITVNLSYLPPAAKALEFMGKLSDDMFIMHIAVRTVLVSVIYSTDSAFITYALLVILSTVITWAFKALKKLAGYDKLVSKVGSKLEFKSN